MTALKAQSTLTTGTGVGDTQPGFEIDIGSGAGNGQQSFEVVDFSNSPIFSIPKRTNGSAMVFGDRLCGTHDYVSGSYVACAQGTGSQQITPPCLWFPDGTTAQGLKLWAGSGLPTAAGNVDTVGPGASVGDIYLRTDTPSTSLQRVYRCSVAGSPGTWVGIF